MRPCPYSSVPVAVRRLGALLLVLWAAGAARGEEDGSPDPWTLAGELRFREAHAAFGREGRPDTPEERFGRALALLNAQPKTERRLSEAAALFERTVAGDPASDLAVRSLYYLGRIAQIHRYAPDRDEAARHYERIVRNHPKHPYAELAATKLALVRLYAPVGDDERRRRFAELEPLAGLATTDAGRRDFHYVLGAAAVAFALSDERALHHLRIAEEAGILQARTRATVYTRIAELARSLGQNDVAATYYRRLLAEFPRDERAPVLRERLASLQR